MAQLIEKAGEDGPSPLRVQDGCGAGAQVGPYGAFQMEDELRVGQEVGVPARVQPGSR